MIFLCFEFQNLSNFGVLRSIFRLFKGQNLSNVGFLSDLKINIFQSFGFQVLLMSTFVNILVFKCLKGLDLSNVCIVWVLKVKISQILVI